MWKKIEITNHKKAAVLLNKAMRLVFQYIRDNHEVTEFTLQQFILQKYLELGLVTDNYLPIVAFRENSAEVHYYPNKKSKRLKDNSLILIDVWAKLKTANSPFADITWMAFLGKNIPSEIQHIFDLVIDVREQLISFLKNKLAKGVIPTGREINELTKSLMAKLDYNNKVNLYTGHCLGNYSAHGNKKNINKYNNSSLLPNVGYTIEPGIYIKNKFGIRSEIDFYITKKLDLIITNEQQKEIVRI